MITRYSVWMNNKGLQDIDESIYIKDIREKEPKQQAITAARAWGDGLRLLRLQRKSLSVDVRFEIRERDPARRRDICSRIRSWAREGYLTTSDRPGQRLYVVCDRLPTVDSALRWTRDIEMTFTAYDVPYWEAITPAKCTVTAQTPFGDGQVRDTVTMRMVGDVASPLDATITAAGKINFLRVALGDGQTITLEDLGMKSGDVLTISHDSRGILALKKNGESVLNKRTAKSYDELMISPNESVTIALRADAVCTGVFSVRGRCV